MQPPERPQPSERSQPPEGPQALAAPTDGVPTVPAPTASDRSRSEFRSVHDADGAVSGRRWTRSRWRWAAVAAALGIVLAAIAGSFALRTDDTEPVSDGQAIQDEYRVDDDLEAVVEELPAVTVSATNPPDSSDGISIRDAALVRSDLVEAEWELDVLGDFRLCGTSTLFDQAEGSARVAFTQTVAGESSAAIRQLTSVVIVYPTARDASIAFDADLDRTEACVGTSSLPSGETYETTAREGVSPERLACSDVFASTIIELRNPEADTPYIGQRRSFTRCGRFVALTAYLITDPDDSFEHPDVSRAETVATERFVELVQGN